MASRLWQPMARRPGSALLADGRSRPSRSGPRPRLRRSLPRRRHSRRLAPGRSAAKSGHLITSARMQPPQLSGVVVHWRNEELLAQLTSAWPRDPRFELVVVDNGSSVPLELGSARLVQPEGNLGFGGGANAGAAETRGPILLILNPDAIPKEGALDRLLEGFEAFPDAAGLAPKLVGPGGESQAGWQLRRLPSPWRLLLQAFPFAGMPETPADAEP